MDKDTYCIKVCGGKCCTLYPPGEDAVVCPRLSGDRSCSVYQKRYGALGDQPLVVVGRWESKKNKDVDGRPVVYNFYCGRVEEIISSGSMPQEIMAQCCYAHPELLEKKESCDTK
jgi:hypothetical protein